MFYSRSTFQRHQLWRLIFLFVWGIFFIINASAENDKSASPNATLRCGIDIVKIGDSVAQVLTKCGTPSEREKYCAPVVIPPHQRPFGNGCTPGERFIYTNEPSSIKSTIEFIDGMVYRIY